MTRRVESVLETAGLGALADRYPRQLSGGQQQRVALARVLVLRPKLLLFDEPLSNLDARLRVQMRGEIRQLQKSLGITALFVTHDQDEALGDRRPDRGDEPRPHRAGRHAVGNLPGAGDPLRRRLHRHAPTCWMP